jgi:hypothetical protein
VTSYVVRQIALLAYLEESLVNVALLLSQERIPVLSVHNLSMLLQSGTLTPRGTSTRSRWFNAELLDLSSMTIPELATSLQWSTTWVGTISNNDDCYTKPLCSTRSIKALLESIFLMTCVLWLEHPGCLISVLTAKFSRVSMYISFHFIQEQSLPGITSHLTIFANQPQVSKHLPCLQLSHLM